MLNSTIFPQWIKCIHWVSQIVSANGLIATAKRPTPVLGRIHRQQAELLRYSLQAVSLNQGPLLEPSFHLQVRETSLLVSLWPSIGDSTEQSYLRRKQSHRWDIEFQLPCCKCRSSGGVHLLFNWTRNQSWLPFLLSYFSGDLPQLGLLVLLRLECTVKW